MLLKLNHFTWTRPRQGSSIFMDLHVWALFDRRTLSFLKRTMESSRMCFRRPKPSPGKMVQFELDHFIWIWAAALARGPDPGEMIRLSFVFFSGASDLGLGLVNSRQNGSIYAIPFVFGSASTRGYRFKWIYGPGQHLIRQTITFIRQ